MYVEHLRLPVGPHALHVERCGRGTAAVVLVHGFGTHAAYWRPVACRLATAGFVALAVDLLGHGESDRPADAGYDLPSQADRLERVLAALRLERATVVGQDVGGLVALALAARHPALVERLVLVNVPDPSALPPEPVRAMQRAAARTAISGTGQPLGAAALLAPLLVDSAEPGDVPAATLARYLAPWVGAEGVEQLQRLARVLEDESIPLDSLADVPCPALVVRGTRDRSVRPTVAAAVAGALPAGQVELVEEGGRLLAEERPEEFAQLVLRWVEPPAFPRPDA
jgi:pimeloyl-ACP methyl ester carboxylesterase